MNSFQENLALGREWETKVSLWLQQNQNYVLDVYEYTGTGVDGSKAPKLRILPSEEVTYSSRFTGRIRRRNALGRSEIKVLRRNSVQREPVV